ncbi:MAG TPA: hypothetical protein DEA58_02685, partial [Pseudothermotoga sp.]|nr:hypothetical protein [Pseudothermotoga sp.]
MVRKTRESIVTFLIFLFIVALIGGLFLSVFSFFYYLNQKKEYEKSLDRKSTRLNSSHANISYAV